MAGQEMGALVGRWHCKNQSLLDAAVQGNPGSNSAAIWRALAAVRWFREGFAPIILAAIASRYFKPELLRPVPVQ
jgi:hypothetical protein